MQQHLAESTAWMQILPLPTSISPAAICAVSLHDFQAKHSFHPKSYADWLALVGKKEASVGGIGLSGNSAAKLLSRYGNLQGIARNAEAGQLRSWGVRVEEAFMPGSPALAKACANRALFVGNNIHHVLSPKQQEAVSSRLASMPSMNRDSLQHSPSEPPEHELAWAHPLHAARWRCAAPYAEQLAAVAAEMGVAAHAKAVTESGLPVDVFIDKVAVLLCCQCDFEASTLQSLDAMAQEEGPVGKNVLAAALRSNTAGGGIVSRLNGPMRHHVTLLRKAGAQPCCIPWWQVPQSA